MGSGTLSDQEVFTQEFKRVWHGKRVWRADCCLFHYKDKELVRVSWIETGTRSCYFTRSMELLPTGHCGYKQCTWIRNPLDTRLEEEIHQR